MYLVVQGAILSCLGFTKPTNFAESGFKQQLPLIKGFISTKYLSGNDNPFKLFDMPTKNKKKRMRASTHQQINELTNPTSTSQHSFLFDPVSLCVKVCASCAASRLLCLSATRSLAGRTAGSFDSHFMLVNLSHRIPPLGYYRRIHR